MKLYELKILWGKEKEHYKTSEVGSGVQSFVWEMFECPDLFNLSRGLKSTEDHLRKNEFLLEESNAHGQADAVIFMDSNVVVPVEVEKLDNVQSGEWQILKYRTAFDKKFGILTDGFEWRFYYGEMGDNQHYKFTIDEIFKDATRFRTFWEEYTKPQNYYLSYFEEIGQRKMAFFDVKKKVDSFGARFFKDVTEIIKKLKDKLLNAGYFQAIIEKQERDKKATEIAYSYLIQFILYKTLVDNSFQTFEKEFTKLSGLIHQNLKKKSYNTVLMILEGMSGKISENIYKPFHKEQETIIAQVKTIVHSGEENIMSVAPFLDIFIFIKQYDFANVNNDIFGAIYENYLKELYEEKNLGQYFTDPTVVNFMLEQIGYSAEKIKARGYKNISIVDASCGSGTFLYSAVREIMKAGETDTESAAKKIEEEVLENVFGLDIAEFPLYLAEMSILMKMLPIVVNEKYNNPIDKKLKLFVTEDSVAEFINEIGDAAIRSGGEEQGKLGLEWKYEGFMRDERDLDEMKDSLNTVKKNKEIIPRRRYDFVIGNPPYIGYNECSRMGVKVFKLLQKKSSVSLNNIYGWNLHSVPDNRKKYAPKPNLFAFFLALGFALLKKNGRLCYIIPQTLLTAGDLDVLRYQLSEEYTIENIYTFAGNLFVGRGTDQKKKIATSSLILVCTKQEPPKDHVVECVHLCDEDLDIEEVFSKLRTNQSPIKKSILQKKFRDSVENWNFVQWDLEFTNLYEKYLRNSESIDIYFDHAKAEDRFGERFYFDKGLVFPKDKIRKDRDGDFLLIRNTKDYAPRIRNESIDQKHIRLPHGAQGFGVFDSTNKIVWSYMNPNNFKLSSEKIMLDFNWVIISSNHREETLFLFAILNSKLIWILLNSLLRIQNEQSFSLGIKTIKEFVRIPKITTANKEEKSKTIVLANRMLEAEKRTLEDLVEIDTLMQHFDDVRVKGNEVLLRNGSTEVRGIIKDGATKLVEKTFQEHFGSGELLSAKKAISLADLKNLPVSNEDERIKIKNQIDEIVFDLYGLTQTHRALIIDMSQKLRAEVGD